MTEVLTPSDGKLENVLVSQSILRRLVVSGEFSVVAPFLHPDGPTLPDFEAALAPSGPFEVPSPQAEQTILFRSEVDDFDEPFEVVVPLRWPEGLKPGVGFVLRFSRGAAVGIREYWIIGVGDLPAWTKEVVVEPLPSRPIEYNDDPDPEASPVPERWRPQLDLLVRRVVRGDFDGLAADGYFVVVEGDKPENFGLWIREYGETLVDLPDRAWELSDHGPDLEPNHWWVVIPMWSSDGPSDLSLEATVLDSGTDPVSIQLHGVRVL